MTESQEDKRLMFPEQKQNELGYADQKDYQARFLLTPNLKENFVEDYDHYDKNYGVTNLNDNPKYKIDEVGEIRAIEKGLHILTLPRYFLVEERLKQVEVREVQATYEGQDIILKQPVVERTLVNKSLYPTTFHQRRSQHISFVESAAVRNGWRLSMAVSNNVKIEKSIIDKTEVQSKWYQPKPRDNQREEMY
jgi:hypothetical protein